MQITTFDILSRFIRKMNESPENNQLKVYISGKHDGLTKKQIRQATRTYLNYLVGNRMTDKLTIFIKFVPHDKIFHGDMTWLDSNHRPREFQINITYNKSKKRMLTTLAHEMIHVKQFVKGEMKDYISHDRPSTWYGKPIKNSTNYFKLPWEVEAHGREHEVYALLNS